MAALCELKRQPGHEPDNITYRGREARGLVLDLRDERALTAELLAALREAETWLADSNYGEEPELNDLIYKCRELLAKGETL